MLCKTRIASAAAPWVGDRLHDEPHQGAIVHAGAHALYFTSRGDVLGIAAATAVPVPLALRTQLPDLRELPGGLPQTGERVRIGAGAVDLGGAAVHVARYLDYRMPPLPRGEAHTLVRRLDALRQPASELPRALLTALTARPAEEAHRLLGRGSGLTPYGDDGLAGMLAALLAAGDACAPRLAAVVTRLAPQRTTLLSATLLRRAAAGEVLPQFARLAAALARGTDGEVRGRAATLTAVGHTSGAGMLRGLHLGLTHITMRSCT